MTLNEHVYFLVKKRELGHRSSNQGNLVSLGEAKQKVEPRAILSARPKLEDKVLVGIAEAFNNTLDFSEHVISEDNLVMNKLGNFPVMQVSCKGRLGIGFNGSAQYYLIVEVTM